MENRICKKCNIEKPTEEFVRAKGEHTYKCLLCNREEGKQRYKNMMSKPDKKEKRNDKKRVYGKNWYHTRKQDPVFRQMRLDWQTNERKTNEVFAMKIRVRSRTRMFLNKRGYTKTWKTQEMLGCTYLFLSTHLESMFTEGMSWDNRDMWHIDHIIPLSSAKSVEDVYKLGHYTNLQPLWGPENRFKSGKLLYDFEFVGREIKIKDKL